MESLLREAKLDQYLNKFDSLGFDDVEQIEDMSEAELYELCETVFAEKIGHEARFKKCSASRQSESVTVTSSPSPCRQKSADESKRKLAADLITPMHAFVS